MATYDIDSLPTSFSVGDIINCPYSGTIKSIALPKGKYKFELWGGGIQAKMDPDKPTPQGNGGYTVGNYTVSNPTILYLVSGGRGTFGSNSGYNGGGSIGGETTLNGVPPQIFYQQMSQSTRGGGATHIALVPGLLSEIGANNLSSILAVAGGAGGPNIYKRSGTSLLTSSALGVGGGTTGLPTTGDFAGQGGTQSAGGAGGRLLPQMVAAEAGSFGKGGSGFTSQYTEFAFSDTQSISMYASGGGGGLYGGGGAAPVISNGQFVSLANAGGGSGYVSDTLEEAATYNTDDTTPEPPVGTYGDGYIRITVLSLVHQNAIVKANGTWEDCTPLIKANNAWKDVDKMFVKVDGVWQPVIDNVHPPIALPPKMPPEGTLLAQFYKTTGFTTLKNSDDGIFKSGQDGGYFFYKILTDDTFALDLQIDFKSGVPNEAFYGLSIADNPTKYDASEFHGAYPLIHPDYDDYSGRKRIIIPGGKLNKYIIGYADYDPDGYVEKGDFTILNSCYNGYIYI